jgi:mannose-6-phosphate isomerase-like protein (cupin superfamily)
MERRNFIVNAGLLTAFAGISKSSFASANETEPLKPIMLQSQPPLEHNGGMAIRTWMRSSMTNGLYSSVECAVAPKMMGPPPHYHKELDEIMYVAEGTASVIVGEEVVEINAGGWHLRPRMIQHTFWNASDKPLRFIDMYFNQPFEEYLERIFHELIVENGYIDGTEKKMNEINKLNEKFGLVFPSTAFDQRNEIVKKYNLK